jgi:hypothetical protein
MRLRVIKVVLFADSEVSVLYKRVLTVQNGTRQRSVLERERSRY